jgi:hypothetical protein
MHGVALIPELQHLVRGAETFGTGVVQDWHHVNRDKRERQDSHRIALALAGPLRQPCDRRCRNSMHQVASALASELASKRSRERLAHPEGPMFIADFPSGGVAERSNAAAEEGWYARLELSAKAMLLIALSLDWRAVVGCIPHS